MVPLGAEASRHTTLGLLTKAKRFIKVSHGTSTLKQPHDLENCKLFIKKVTKTNRKQILYSQIFSIEFISGNDTVQLCYVIDITWEFYFDVSAHFLAIFN